MNDETLSEQEIRRRKKNAAQLAYYYRHKEKLLQKQKHLRESDPNFRIRHRAYSAAYVKRHKERRKETTQKYYLKNKELCTARSVLCVRKKRMQNPDLAREKAKLYFNQNREKWRAYFREYTRKTRATVRGKLEAKIRGRIWAFIKANSRHRRPHVNGRAILDWFEWLKAKGICDWQAEGMHIDHVIPISRFNINCPSIMRHVNAWWNLFPMPAIENMSKGDAIDPRIYRKVRKLVCEYINETGTSTLA